MIRRIVFADVAAALAPAALSHHDGAVFHEPVDYAFLSSIPKEFRVGELMGLSNGT